MHRSGLPASLPIALALLLVCGCTAESYTRDADRVVDEILRTRTQDTLGGREASVAHPRETAPPTLPEPPAAAPGAGAVRVLSLADALEIAYRTNREHISRKEALYETALALNGEQFAYSPQVTAALSYIFAGSNTAPELHTSGVTAGLSQVLPWGGKAALVAASGFEGGPLANLFSSSLSLQVSQPLLRGAGREVAWEGLVQAERSVVYAIRDYELYREGFSIDVASRFYDLVQQKQSLENQRRTLESQVFGRKQAEALFSVGRTPELEVLRAKRSELTSQNSAIEAEEGLKLALDRFRIFLGLPDGEAVDVHDEEPAFVEVHYEVESAVEVALANRLDWVNRLEQLEDARRGVRIAANGLLPDLALDLGYTRAGDGDPSFVGQRFENGSYHAGLTLSIPLQRTIERNAYRSAQYSLASAMRSVDEFKDNLIVSVRGTFRELARRKQSLEIQSELISDQQRNVKIAQLRFEQGNFSNRDVVEAQQSLLDAQNALIHEKVAYEIARLGLLKDLGILFIDEKGMWK
jgi:outer membrane protein TolC